MLIIIINDRTNHFTPCACILYGSPKIQKLMSMETKRGYSARNCHAPFHPKPKIKFLDETL
jgi:hypothetical protein